MAKKKRDKAAERLRREELERLAAEALPNRENMSLISLGGSGVLGGLADPLDPSGTPDAGESLPAGTDDSGQPTDSSQTAPFAGTVAGLANLAAEEASTDADGSSTISEDGTISSHDTASSET
jgi:hypothetical protein